jgi:murein DD-endopeptidase MepM/ murein hydrolase activator NlpD
MARKGKHQKILQILVIPDDKAEPKTFSLPIRRLKLIKILAFIIGLHVLTGFFFYYQSYRLNQRNNYLKDLNQQLQSNNEKVYELLSAFEELESDQTRIRAALGLGTITAADLSETVKENVPNIMHEVIPAYKTEERDELAQSIDLQSKLGFLKRSDSGIHDYVKSIPTFLPVEGVLTNDYEDIQGMNQTLHRGIDIAASRGSMVRAAADGVVIFAGWTQDLGELLVLYHGNGYRSYYGHNQRLLVERNSLVKKGEPIALLGNTGQSTAPHLHFEVWKDGVPLDPKNYLLSFSNIE